MTPNHKAVGGTVFTGLFAGMLLLAAIGGWFLIQRFTRGLGAVTNMSDGFPWGIWITFDVLVGTAIGCGGFAMAILVYVFNRGEYHPLVRSAVMTSLFGYALAGASIFVDIGRYGNMLNVFNPALMNFNSVLLEVALCIAAYIGVLFLEFLPAVLEGRGGPQAARGYNRIMFLLVAIGVLLPLMHQSSLGTLMVISGNKLSPLWQSGLLPFFNVLSAILMGYAIVVFESYLSARAFGRPFETPLLRRLSGVVAPLLLLFLVARWGDLLLRGALGHAFTGIAGAAFWLENILLVAPLFLLLPASKRASGRNLCLASFLLLLGGAVLKFNMYIVGFQPAPGWRYFPSVSEIMITLAIVAVEIMAYLVLVRKLPVLPAAERA